ncbi:MAG: type II toxin-antitoxin system YafQ family toxin [Magnetococcales bacterium]|nr:type II toxin-antitoxin system YafQ family toxin [Magnetococcales bacterium]MBF0150330.1 type II toxin-antitoxin system YafQ family toxin [Magnetococcales bacterium]
MRELSRTTQFKKDLELVKKRGKNLKKLIDIVDKLVESKPIPERNKAHHLDGDMAPLWECHIEPDWLLIWDEDENEVILVRTGSHSDLFG